MEPQVDRIRRPFERTAVPPALEEARVVVAAALGAGTMPGRERGRLVEEEELRVPARLHQRRAPAVPEPEPACDPPLHLIAADDAAGVVVEAAAVSVDEAARRIGDELSERCHAVLERHLP